MPSPSTFSAPISDRRSGRARLLVLGAAFVLPLLFATYTGHIWEDFYITFRISKNLVAGHGLVFQPGERVHTFTSPLGVLIPALCSWLTGANNDQAAVWLFRLISAGFLAATADLLWRIARQLQLARPGLALLFGLFLFDAKIADFSMNGMETALLVFFFAWTIRALVTGPVTPWRLGVGLGGLMWTRPDGFVFGGALLAGFLWFVWRTRPATEWRGLGTGLARAAAIAGILYLPWFAWAWWYYGSPIPQTILAKSALNISHDFFHTLTTYPFHLLMGTSRVSGLFMPTYHYFGGWPDELGAYSILLTFPAVGYFFVPRAHPIGRALSFALFLGGAYLQIAPPEPWYNQVWQVLAMIVLAIVVTDAVRLFAWLSATSGTAIRYCSRLRIAVGILLVVQVSLWACAAIQMRINQREIEEGIRRQVGLWLHEHAKSGDTVMLEPLGYIGYFSGLKMLDVPGLSAPEVTAAIKSGARTWPEIIARLQPGWLVLRPREIQQIQSANPGLLTSVYQRAKVFDARARINAYRFLPGSHYTLNDAVFIVFHRSP